MSGWRRYKKHAGFYKVYNPERQENFGANLDPKRVKYTKRAIESLSLDQAHNEAERILAEYRKVNA